MNENKSLFLTDDPDTEKDSFQIHTNISETIFEIIEKHNVNKNSFTIGLFGEWGSGKSFIINRLSKKIENQTNNTTFINIDVWKYSGQPLLRSILFELNNHFKRFYKKDKNKYEEFKDGYKNSNGKSLQDILYYDEIFESESRLTIEEYKRALKNILVKYKTPLIILAALFIGFILLQFVPTDLLQSKWYLKILQPIFKGIAFFSAFVGLVGIFIGLLQKPLKDIGNLIFFRNTVKNFNEKANFSPEQFEGIFKDMLSKVKNEKYVIVFDNIDRCEPQIAYETLSTIKTFMDEKNCFYLIPADDEAIKKYLSSSESNDKNNNSFKRKFAEEFIDKIFQTYIRIPILKEVERDNYIQEQLKKIDFEGKLKEDDINTIMQILYFAYKGESPRNIIRFLNDFSTYFRLSLKSLPELLNNITLFTVMIAIKQKWYQFENILNSTPFFFSDYPESVELIPQNFENRDELIRFLKNISVSYIPQIEKESINSYVHFKESEKSYEISESLKNNQPENIELNNETVKILINEFKKNILVKGAFSVNSYLAFSHLIVNNLSNKLSNKLIKEFWIGFTTTPSEQIKSIIGELLDENALNEIFNTLKNKGLTYHKNKIEKTIILFLKEPIENDTEYEDYEKVFEIILKSDYKFTPKTLKQIFLDWKKESQYLNALLNQIKESGKDEYLPENVFSNLVTNVIDDRSIEIMSNWKNNNIPPSLGVTLVKKFLERLKARNIVNLQQLTAQKVHLDQDRELLLLIDSSFVKQGSPDEFLKSLINITTKIFQFSSNQRSFLELGTDFWLEASYFSTINNEYVDAELDKTFKSYIKPNPTVISILINKIKYPENLLSLQKTKLSLFDSSSELQNVIYSKLLESDTKKFNNYKLIMPYPISISHIEVFTEFMGNHDLKIDNHKFSEFLLKLTIKELINESINVSEKLNYLNNNYSLKPHKEIIIQNKNGIIDFYKEDPTNNNNILLPVKSILSYSEFFSNLLKPILTYIKSELAKSEPVSAYGKLSELIESTKNERDLNLLHSVSKGCLENNQSIEENLFGIKILIKINNEISKEQRNELSNLILTNDHYEQWDMEIVQKLSTIGIKKENNGEE